MIKKNSVIGLLLLICLSVPKMAFADTFYAPYFGTTSITDFMWADSSMKDDIWTTLIVKGVGKGQVLWFDKSGNQIGSDPVPDSVQAPDGAFAFKLKSTDGGEIHAKEGASSNPNATLVYFDTTGVVDGPPADTGGGSTTCDSCAVFDCPNWDEYMGKVDQIIGAIPPAPDWDKVAETFRDTIAPQIKSDLQDVIGSAPAEETAPSQPSVNVPDVSEPDPPPDISGVDDGGFKNNPPTGQEDSNLGTSSDSLDEDNIKNSAPVITENSDPTGGFKLEDDPMSGLCTLPTNNFPIPGQTNAGNCGQNKPAEQDTSFPAPPKDDGDYSTPTNPKDDGGGDYSAPTAPKDDGETPSEPTNPSDNTDTPPVPSDDGGDTGTQYYKDNPD